MDGRAKFGTTLPRLQLSLASTMAVSITLYRFTSGRKPSKSFRTRAIEAVVYAAQILIVMIVCVVAILWKRLWLYHPDSILEDIWVLKAGFVSVLKSMSERNEVELDEWVERYSFFHLVERLRSSHLNLQELPSLLPMRRKNYSVSDFRTLLASSSACIAQGRKRGTCTSMSW